MTVPSLLLSIVVVAIVAFGLVWASRRFMFAFEIRIAAGRASLRSGRPRPGFLVDVQEIADRNGVTHGKVRGVGEGRKMRLSFTGKISDEARQQLRNAWALRR